MPYFNLLLYIYFCTDCSFLVYYFEHQSYIDACPKENNGFQQQIQSISKGTSLRANMHALQQHRSKNSIFIPPSLLPLPSSYLTLSQTDPPGQT